MYIHNYYDYKQSIPVRRSSVRCAPGVVPSLGPRQAQNSGGQRRGDSVNMAAGGGALHVSVPCRPSGGGFTEVDSSESDGETEPAESFHRRISTNKEIKSSVSIAAAGVCRPPRVVPRRAGFGGPTSHNIYWIQSVLLPQWPGLCV